MRSSAACVTLLAISLGGCGGSPPETDRSSAAPHESFAGEARCELVDSLGECAVYGVSLIDLIANASDYHGRRVQVIGYVELRFEGNGIYLSGEPWARIHKNGLWLHPPPEFSLANPEFSPGFMIVNGIFDAEDSGHLGLWSGAIHKIERFERWTDQEDSAFVEIQ
jgi:hypothetical protein